MDQASPARPPSFVRCGPIEVNNQRRGGWWGACPGRGCLGYATERDSYAHRLRELGAYAISVNVLQKIQTLGVERVFVVETDTGTILEYRIEQFLEEGEAVPDEYLQDIYDPQRFAGTELAAGRWEDAFGAFYRDSPVTEAAVLSR